VTGQLGLELVGRGDEITEEFPKDYWSLAEAVVSPGSILLGRTPEGFALRSRFEINLLAVSRQGRPCRGRLKDFRFQVGDVLLLQGSTERPNQVIGEPACLPLADRGIALGRGNQALLSVVLFGGGIALAAAGLLSAPIALGLAAMLCILTGIIRADEAYKAIDWRIIVLLGAFIPVGNALETTGATGFIARQIAGLEGVLPTVVILGVVMVVTMTLSDVINNAATAVVMAPLASAIANGLGVSADPFLMAVAIGASCAFLTPIGHQNNTLVLGPGGYKFGDYWRLGLPLEIIIVAVSMPLLLIVWPL
jgi:di/tricarboxylate transporter